MQGTGQTFVIVGASLAGAKAAEALRAEGFDGRVVLFGEESRRPYERPPLSKEYLRGEKDFDAAAVHPAIFYEEHDIELHTSTPVVEIDPAGRAVTLSSGERVAHDRLLLTTGAAPRHLAVDGADLDGVLSLRTVDDADRLRRGLTSEAQVVVIGAGWIGAEVAASARQLGAAVSMVELYRVPLERVLGAEVGAIYRDLHAALGVDLHSGVGVEAITGRTSVEAVRLSDGTVLPADVVVVGVGVLPRTELAEAAGLVVDNGVVVDEHLQTSVPGSSPRATSPTHTTPATGPASGSSTGRLRSTRVLRPHAPCSATTSSTTERPTSSRTSTTSGWNTGAGRRTSTRWSCAATPRAAPSWASGSATARSPRR